MPVNRATGLVKTNDTTKQTTHRALLARVGRKPLNLDLGRYLRSGYFKGQLPFVFFCHVVYVSSCTDLEFGADAGDVRKEHCCNTNKAGLQSFCYSRQLTERARVNGEDRLRRRF